MFSFAERYHNIKEKCKDLKNVEVSDVERNISENWRFYDTLKSITDIKGDKNDFYIAIGSDSLINFKTWYKWQDILKMVKLIVFTRPGYTASLPNDFKYEIVQMNNDVSSTQLRKQLLDSKKDRLI